jgi:glycosyltransferase involved in cell wall biosynthesis
MSNNPGPTRTSPTIAALLVVHNEEHYIRGALESIADTVDSIMVVHDGPCSDRTLEIAKAYTNQVRCTADIHGSAEFIRPRALAQIDADWVLILDADERLSPDLQRILRSLTGDPVADSYGFSWPYVDNAHNRIGNLNLAGKRFLFRRSMMYTIGLPHMTPDTYGRNVSRPDLEVWHVMKHNHGWGQLRRMFRVNRKRARQAANVLRKGAGAVETYNADVAENRAGNVRKLRLLATHPVIALVIVPLSIFFRRYFLLGYFRTGLSGLHDALNIPVYYAWISLYRIRDGLKRKAPAT